MSKSGLTPYQDELLEIIAEECGELVQEKSKIIRFGIDELSHHIEGFTHRQCLEQELGDLLAMVELLIDSDIGITYNGVEEAKQRKKQKVVKWMNHKKPEPPTKAQDRHAEAIGRVVAMAKHQLRNYKDEK